MESNYKQDICNKIAVILNKEFDISTKRFENIFYSVVGKYEIQLACTDLVVVDNSDVEVIKKFLVSKRLEGLADSTLHAYGYEIKKFYGFLNNQKAITDVTSDDIRCYIADGTINRNWTPIRSNNIRRYLSSFYTWLFDEEYISRNPVRKIKQIKTPKNIRVPFTEIEVEKMRDYLGKTKYRNMGEEKAIRDKAIFELLLSTGCRVGELCGIKIGDIDFKNNEIKVIGKKGALYFFLGQG